MNRCYMRKITEKESEDQLDVGCTNEAGCMIHDKQCASSGDCTSSCCESDLCNSGLSSKSCAIPSSLLITGYFVISLLLWVPSSVNQDMFQEKNKEGKFPDKIQDNKLSNHNKFTSFKCNQRARVILESSSLGMRLLLRVWALTLLRLKENVTRPDLFRTTPSFLQACLGQKAKYLLLSVSGILKKETRKELA